MIAWSIAKLFEFEIQKLKVGVGANDLGFYMFCIEKLIVTFVEVDDVKPC